MPNTIEITSIIVLTIFTVLYLLLKKPQGKLYCPTYENAKAAIDKLKDWGIWMTSLQTAAIGVIGVSSRGLTLGFYQRYSGFFALLFFGYSILLSTWLLASLPSLLLRLDSKAVSDGSTDNDIYNMQIFSFIPIKVGPMTGLQHLYFVTGIFCFAVFMYQQF